MAHTPGAITRQAISRSLSDASLFAEKRCRRLSGIAMGSTDDEQPLLHRAGAHGDDHRGDSVEPPEMEIRPSFKELVVDVQASIDVWLSPSYTPISMFLNDTLVYIVSRQWVDLLFIELFRYHPLPFCAEPRSDLPCTPEAPSGVQARLALGILLAAAILRRTAAGFGPGTAVSWLGSSPMAGYLSGWACGFTAVKALRELAEAYPGHDYLYLAVTLFATAVVAVTILVLRPSTVVMGCFGGGAKLLQLVRPRVRLGRRSSYTAARSEELVASHRAAPRTAAYLTTERRTAGAWPPRTASSARASGSMAPPWRTAIGR